MEDNIEKHKEAAARFRLQVERDARVMQARGQAVSKTFRTEILNADSEGAIDLQFLVGPEYGNFFGGVQGGVLTALLDDACSYAVVARQGVHCFLGTVELHTRILKKAKLGAIRAKARITSASRFIVHVDAELYSEDVRVAAGSAVISVDTSRPINEAWVANV